MRSKLDIKTFTQSAIHRPSDLIVDQLEREWKIAESFFATRYGITTCYTRLSESDYKATTIKNRRFGSWLHNRIDKISKLKTLHYYEPFYLLRMIKLLRKNKQRNRDLDSQTVRLTAA